jgi:hypothetical protein
MNKRFVKDSFGWGLLLWLFGYILGIVLFMVVPVSLIGWIISPIGIVITLWVLLKKIGDQNLHYFLKLSFVWTLMAIILDYLLLVKLFKPEDGYYKLDVYLYYFLTFTLPLAVGWFKSKRRSEKVT